VWSTALASGKNQLNYTKEESLGRNEKREKLRRQRKTNPHKIKEKEPLWYRIS
jgi:hypothetical protein